MYYNSCKSGDAWNGALVDYDSMRRDNCEWKSQYIRLILKPIFACLFKYKQDKSKTILSKDKSYVVERLTFVLFLLENY